MIAKISVGTSPTQLLAAGERRGVILQNQSDTDILIATEGSADLTLPAGAKPGIIIKPGGNFTATRIDLGETMLNKEWWAISSAAGKVMVVHTV